jgi:hypothetical protein
MVAAGSNTQSPHRERASNLTGACLRNSQLGKPSRSQPPFRGHLRQENRVKSGYPSHRTSPGRGLGAFRTKARSHRLGGVLGKRTTSKVGVPCIGRPRDGDLGFIKI